MLRSHLRDGALAAAKAWSHARAERRHVAYAIARHFRDRSEVLELLPIAKEALEPRGTAVDVPVLTEEAATLIDSIASFDEALAVLREILGGDSSASESGVAQAVGSPTATATTDSAPASEAPGEEAESVEAVLAELDQLVGLNEVKRQVRAVIAVVRANQERASAGHATVNPGLHLVFTGPPGTGKTTVARLIARLYAACGALPGSRFTEVDRSALVAGYVGQTAIKTSDAIKKTIPGVLFIDEAYALTPAHASDFGAEAIATLVKAMEDHRNRLAIIVAGYGDEMARFLESNPGLRSRFKTFIDFPDYAPKELVQIFEGFVNKTGLELASDVLEKAGDLFQRAVSRPDFGNARFARSLFEQAYAQMALRAAADGEVEVNELMELRSEDLQWNEPGVEAKGRRIGFADHRGDGHSEEAT